MLPFAVPGTMRVRVPILPPLNTPRQRGPWPRRNTPRTPPESCSPARYVTADDCSVYPLEGWHDDTPKKEKKSFRGYIAGKRRHFCGLRVRLVMTGRGEPVEFSLAAGSEADVRAFKELNLDLPKARSSARTMLAPVTTTKTSSKESVSGIGSPPSRGESTPSGASAPPESGAA